MRLLLVVGVVGLTDEGDAVTKSFEFTRFRQQLQTRPQRQLYGIDMS
jgi:ligand-binding sensor protein